MTSKEAARVATAIARFAYNAELDEFSREVYGREPDDYTQEKFTFMQKHLGGYIGSLDQRHLESFVDAALRRLAAKEAARV